MATAGEICRREAAPARSRAGRQRRLDLSGGRRRKIEMAMVLDERWPPRRMRQEGGDGGEEGANLVGTRGRKREGIRNVLVRGNAGCERD
jgi:hypothetical protein